MKKILGLDLGSSSIGWALVLECETENRSQCEILGMGTRIIPYQGTEGKDFEKGTGESRNAIRTKLRTQRKGYDRYQLRRKYLVSSLTQNGMMPDENLIKLPKLKLWELRDKAVKEKITLPELGRILLWLNQRRGYKSGRIAQNDDKKETEYVNVVKSRHQAIKEMNMTIGQYFYSELKSNELYRVKEKIFPREAYIEEFDKILEIQKSFHAELTDGLINKIRNEIIYYQRPLKSQKGLVSVCEFEGFEVFKDEKKYFVGPKVAPRSSPLYQIGKIWENINNIKISLIQGDELFITLEQKKRIFEHLDNNPKLTKTDLEKILGLKKNEAFFNKQLTNGLQGNVTKCAIKNCFPDGKYNEYLQFDLEIVELNQKGYLYDRKTGEVIDEKNRKIIKETFEKQPLYRLWHTIYSISDHEKCINVLEEKWGFDKETATKLCNLDFTKSGFGNKSAKAIRKILPFLMEGDQYADAMTYAGFNHSHSLTREQNVVRSLSDSLALLPKNSLRQPIVEKILNQMIHVVNAIIEKYGKPDEIRIELARELKQSKEERMVAEIEINKRQRENENIASQLAEYGLRATRNNIIKWRLYQEIDNEEKKLNAMCIYCGQPISLIEAIKGSDVDIEHIIPKSKLFDDSQSNKTLSHRHCNRDKGDKTAFDFMKEKSEEQFQQYIKRVNELFENKLITRVKRDKLLMSENKIPDNFINRQLRESQYISRKAREILTGICYNVWTTSGKVTAELRRLWGWDDVTMNLQLPKYRELGLTEYKEYESDLGNQQHRKEVIVGWTKRDDHRHHAVDALTIACTKQSFIQRFNTLNASKTREDMYKEICNTSVVYHEKYSLLEKYIIAQQPIPVYEVEKAVANILVSLKCGKKVATPGKRKIGKKGNKKVVQNNILIPRGALCEESVYGKIKVLEKEKKIKYLFEHPELIMKTYIRKKVQQRLHENNNNVLAALASLKKTPIYLDEECKVPLQYATCFKEEYVKKYPIDTNFTKVDMVIDPVIKPLLQNRLSKFKNNPKLAFKDIQDENKNVIKWWQDEGLSKPILSVRCFTNLAAVVPGKKDETGKAIGFVKPGNNHHIAIYTNSNGEYVEHVCTFWHAVERKKNRHPVIIKNTSELWEKIINQPEGTYSQSYLSDLPPMGLQLKLSMQQNEMFILGLDDEQTRSFIEMNEFFNLSNYLYSVWSISTNDYWFKHHLETKNSEIKNTKGAKESKRFYRLNATRLLDKNPIKVVIDVIGNISISSLP